jgi:hypothetical protein
MCGGSSVDPLCSEFIDSLVVRRKTRPSTHQQGEGMLLGMLTDQSDRSSESTCLLEVQMRTLRSKTRRSLYHARAFTAQLLNTILAYIPSDGTHTVDRVNGAKLTHLFRCTPLPLSPHSQRPGDTALRLVTALAMERGTPVDSCGTTRVCLSFASGVCKLSCAMVSYAV